MLTPHIETLGASSQSAGVHPLRHLQVPPHWSGPGQCSSLSDMHKRLMRWHSWEERSMYHRQLFELYNKIGMQQTQEKQVTAPAWLGWQCAVSEALRQTMHSSRE